MGKNIVFEELGFYLEYFMKWTHFIVSQKLRARGLQVFSERRYLYRLLHRRPVTQYYGSFLNGLGIYKKN